MRYLAHTNFQNEKTIDSRKIAEMIGMRHYDLLEKIYSYIQILENGKFRSQDFFIESSYHVEGNNKSYTYYLVTRKGCDMIANKLTGTKGVLFTAAYVDEFHVMKEAPVATRLCQEDVLIASLTLQKETRLEVERLGQQVRVLEAKSETRQEAYYTIAGFASLRGIKVDSVKAAKIGKRATRLSNECGYDIGKTHDPRYGHVNTYHVDILSEVFDEATKW